MTLSPAEIRHAELDRGLFGYKRDTVDDLLDEIVESFEQVWRERADLADKVEHLEAEIVRFRELENLLRTTLVSAERASHELRDQARKEAELIVSEAQGEARRVTRDARAELERLTAETHRIKAVLRGALQILEQEGPKTKPEAA
jgi:cell division initiation protein